MKIKSPLYLLLIVFLLLPQCSSNGKSKYSTKVVKPKYHHRWFDRKKDKRTPRLKKVKVQN